MRLFRRKPRPTVPLPQLPEFGVRFLLKKGDKIVRRDAHGEVSITRVSQERVDEQEVLRVTVLRGTGRRRSD